MGREAGGLTEFGEKCRAFRTARDMLMAQQARAMGVSAAFVSAIETGGSQSLQGTLSGSRAASPYRNRRRRSFAKPRTLPPGLSRSSRPMGTPRSLWWSFAKKSIA